MNNQLIPALEPLNMTIDKDIFLSKATSDEPFNLANVSDFNSLITKPQEYNVPVFALSNEQI